MTTELSNKFRNMGFIAACMVVLQHVVHEIPADSSPMVFWFLRMVKWGVCRIAVPFFFLSAGYFLAKHINEDGWWRAALRKRVHTLVIPYLVLNVYGWVFGLLVALMNHTVNEYLGPGFYGHLRHVFGFEVSTPAYGITWFIRALLVLVILSPLIVPCLRKKRLGLVALLAMLLLRFLLDYATFGAAWSHFFMFVFSIEGILFFSLGIFLSMHKFDVGRNKWVCSIFLLAGIISFWIENAFAIRFAHVSGILLTLYGAWGVCPSRAWPAWMTGSSFAVYLLHPAILSYFNFALKRINRTSWPSESILNYLVATVFICILSVLLSVIVSRKLPRLARILFGGGVA